MSFKRGATLLLRDSLPEPDPIPSSTSPFDSSSTPTLEEDHVTITNHRLPVYERVGPYLFTFAAGSFFQNNNSIIVPLTEYVKEAISNSTASASASIITNQMTRPTHLVDTYCGSGLFGITLSDQFERVAGVEISHDSIVAAKKNAEMNGLGEKTEWLCGKAEDIFGGLAEKGFEGGKSCVVCDVSRVMFLLVPGHGTTQEVLPRSTIQTSYHSSRPHVVMILFRYLSHIQMTSNVNP